MKLKEFMALAPNADIILYDREYELMEINIKHWSGKERAKILESEIMDIDAWNSVIMIQINW